MLKGKSTIQLFDAATGEKVLEQRNDNLVTDALDVLLNSKDKLGLLRWWRERSSNSSNGNAVNNITEHVITSPGYALMPMAKRALGGILLWDNNIKEDPSTTVRPDGVYEVGHAGGEYTGTDAYRGSYNTNESGEISGGWRHVWDFSTDKANGTIRCLSLTSQHGGNLGCHCNFEGDSYPLFNHCYFHSGNNYTATDSGYHGITFSGSDTSGSVLYMKKNSDGGLKLLKRFKTQMWYINTYDISRAYLTRINPTVKSKETLPITLTNDYAGVFVYQGKIHELALTSKTVLRHRTFDLNTGAELSSKDISLPFSYYTASQNNPAVYRDGKYYCFTRNDYNEMVIINEQGQKLDSKTLPVNYVLVFPAVIDEFSGNILLCMNTVSSYSGFPVVIRADDSITYPSTTNYLPVTHSSYSSSNMLFAQYIKTDDMNSPFLYFCDANYTADVVPVVNTAYLATINNLQSPITKTSAQTMKITYEIYDE